MERSELEAVFAEEVEETLTTSEEPEPDLWANDKTECPAEVLEKACYSKTAIAKVIADYGASAVTIAAWDALWDGYDLTDWIFRTSEAICYTPQNAEQIRAVVFAGTPGRGFTDGFLCRVATGRFELRSREATQNYLRTAFKQKNRDRWRQRTHQRTSRGPNIEHLCQQVNAKYGTQLKTRRDLEQLLQTVNDLGWNLPLIGGAVLRLDDIRLADGTGPTEVVTREHDERIPSEIGEDEPDLAREDLGGFKHQTDFSAQYDFAGQTERRQQVWNRNDRVANAAIREVFYEKVGQWASIDSPAAARGAAVHKWLGEALLDGTYDETVAALLNCTPRRVRELRREARVEWKTSWK